MSVCIKQYIKICQYITGRRKPAAGTKHNSKKWNALVWFAVIKKTCVIVHKTVDLKLHVYFNMGWDWAGGWSQQWIIVFYRISHFFTGRRQHCLFVPGLTHASHVVQVIFFLLRKTNEEWEDGKNTDQAGWYKSITTLTYDIWCPSVSCLYSLSFHRSTAIYSKWQRQLLLRKSRGF